MASSDIILDFGSRVGLVCEVCHKEAFSAKGFTIHHFDYEGELGKVTYKIYKKKYGRKYKEPYYRDLEPLLKKYPKRFLFCHNKCHQAIERLKRWSKDSRMRLCRFAEMTK